MSENYEAIGIAVRPGTRSGSTSGEGVQKDHSFFLAAENIADLLDGGPSRSTGSRSGRATRCRSRSATRASRERDAWSS